jgi:hypothetical protein
MEDIKLYSEIEHLIIAWNIDGTKTAGYLTREIMGLINQRKIYKEQQELLDEVYENYCKEMIYHPEKNWLDDGNGEKTYRQLLQEEFVNRCKTDTEFSERWGLKIEERELSLEERKKLYEDEFTPGIEITNDNWLNSKLTTRNIPTKLIIISYNDIKLERYE